MVSENQVHATRSHMQGPLVFLQDPIFYSPDPDPEC